MKKTLIALLLVACGLSGFSQVRHEFSAQAGGALTSLKYSTDLGNSTFSGGGLLGVGYTCFFSQRWGITSGLEVAMYSGKLELSSFSDKVPNLTDSDGDRFDFHSAVSGYKEDQSALFLNIPLMARYQTAGKRVLYAAAGVKFGIPLQASYKGTGATFTNRAYYSDLGVWLDAPKFMGLGTFTDREVSESLDFKLAFMLAAEAGVKFDLGNRCSSIYTGVYVDYGLNDVAKGNRTEPFIRYNSKSPIDFSNRSVVESSYMQGATRKAFTDKVAPIAIGLKVTYAFGKSTGVSTAND